MDIILMYHESPPSVSFEGLMDVYRVGDTLSFSIRLEGSWDNDVRFPDTTIKKIQNADGSDTNEIVWIGKGIVRTPEEYADNPDVIIKAMYIEGNATDPLVLEEVGLYTVITEGEDVEGAEKQLRIVG